MPRYYFHLYECGALIADEEGREIADDKIREVAIEGARDLMAEEVKRGQLCLACRIEVVDEAQRSVLMVPFTEALEVTGLQAT